MKYSELIRLLKRNGCEIKRHGKKHDIWVNPETGNFVSVPRHQTEDVPTGLEKKILEEIITNFK